MTPALVLVADLGMLGAAAIDVVLAIVPALPPGSVRVVERDKSGTPDGLRLARLERLRAACSAARMPFVVGARADLARAVGADGVQLPEDGLPPEVVRRAFPELAIGRSCHDRAGLERAAVAGADWALLAPLRAPHSKAATAPPLGLEGFRAAVAGLALPTYALGGVVPADLAPIRAAGGAGLATIGGVFGQLDPVAAARAFLGP
ncbi:MAG: thiamine phosphate synthase [Myxococcota bacterium]